MQNKPQRTAKTAKEHVIEEAIKTEAENLVNFTFQLPKSQRNAFKVKAAINGEKMKDILTKYVQEYIK